jgi:hypothetical protein
MFRYFLEASSAASLSGIGMRRATGLWQTTLGLYSRLRRRHESPLRGKLNVQVLSTAVGLTRHRIFRMPHIGATRPSGPWVTRYWTQPQSDHPGGNAQKRDAMTDRLHHCDLTDRRQPSSNLRRLSVNSRWGLSTANARHPGRHLLGCGTPAN